MRCQGLYDVLLFMWIPDIDPSCVQLWRSLGVQECVVSIRSEFKSTPSLVVTEVHNKVLAVWIRHKSIQLISGARIVEVPHRISDTQRGQVLVVLGKFSRSCTLRTLFCRHGVFDVVGMVDKNDSGLDFP